MDLSQFFLQRRTIHDYTQKSISWNIVESAFYAALQAPNHKLTFPWRFTVIGEKARQKLIQLQWRLKEQKKKAPLTEEEKKSLAQRFLNPSYLVTFSFVTSDNKTQMKEDYAATCCAIQNFSLYLAQLNIGTKWSTGALILDPEFYKLCEIDSRQEEIVGLIWVGEPEKIPPPVKRPPLLQFLKKVN